MHAPAPSSLLQGPFFLGRELSLVDITFTPMVERAAASLVGVWSLFHMTAVVHKSHLLTFEAPRLHGLDSSEVFGLDVFGCSNRRV